MILIDTIIFKTGNQYWFNKLESSYDKRLESILTKDELFTIVNKFNNIIIQNNIFVLSCICLTMILIITAVPLIIKGLLFWWLILLLGIILILSIQWFIQFQYKNDNLSPQELAQSLSEEYKDRSITFNWKKINYNNTKFNGASYFLSINHPRPFYSNKESSSSLNKIQFYYSNKHLLNNNESEKILNDINSSSSYNNNSNNNNNNKQKQSNESGSGAGAGDDDEINDEGINIPLLSQKTTTINYKDLIVN